MREQTPTEHKHYTVASLNERLLFKQFSDFNPGLIQNVHYTDVEGNENYDVIFTLSGETKPRIADIKVRDSFSTWDGYTIEKKKYEALQVSATTYTPTYINFFKDGSRFYMWDLSHPENHPAFESKPHQHNNIDNRMVTKVAADLYVTASTIYNMFYNTRQTKDKAEIIYNYRLNNNKWKKLKMK